MILITQFIKKVTTIYQKYKTMKTNKLIEEIIEETECKIQKLHIYLEKYPEDEKIRIFCDAQFKALTRIVADLKINYIYRF